MRFIKIITLTAVMLLGATGCTIRHNIQEDYPQYLNNNTGNSNLPSTSVASDYVLSQRSKDFSYEFRAVTTGYANLWVVDIGKMLQDTMQSKDVQAAFNSLTEQSAANSDSDGLLVIELKDYTFVDYGAHITLEVSLLSQGKTVFTKQYTEDGKTQGSKMFWAGAFGQKNAVQQSTKLAIDVILTNLIHDLNAL